MLFFHHFDVYGQRDNKRSIHPLSNINGIAVAEEGELAAHFSQEIPLIITNGEMPVPNVTVHMEGHTVLTLDLEALAKKGKLLVHISPMLTITVNIVAGSQGDKPLFDVDQFLPGITIMHDQIITDMEELPTNLKNRMAPIITNDKRFG